MGTNLVQLGSGATRDVWIVYHAGGFELKPAGPNAVIIGETRKGFTHSYDHFASDAVLTVADLIVYAKTKAGPFDVGKLVLAGFSEGCQAVRLHLSSGVVPSGVLCIDGAHTSRPPNPANVKPWADYARLAAEWRAAFTLTHTNIQPQTYMSTAETADLIVKAAGLNLSTPEATSDGGTVQTQGLVRVSSYPQGDAGAHVYQANTILPHEAAIMAKSLAFVKDVPIIPDSHTPDPVKPKPAPPPPPSDDGGSGGGLLVLAALGLVAITRKKLWIPLHCAKPLGWNTTTALRGKRPTSFFTRIVITLAIKRRGVLRLS